MAGILQDLPGSCGADSAEQQFEDIRPVCLVFGVPDAFQFFVNVIPRVEWRCCCCCKVAVVIIVLDVPRVVFVVVVVCCCIIG